MKMMKLTLVQMREKHLRFLSKIHRKNSLRHKIEFFILDHPDISDPLNQRCTLWAAVVVKGTKYQESVDLDSHSFPFSALDIFDLSIAASYFIVEKLQIVVKYAQAHPKS